MNEQKLTILRECLDCRMSSGIRHLLKVEGENGDEMIRKFELIYGDIIRRYRKGKQRRNLKRKLLKMKGITMTKSKFSYEVGTDGFHINVSYDDSN